MENITTSNFNFSGNASSNSNSTLSGFNSDLNKGTSVVLVIIGFGIFVILFCLGYICIYGHIQTRKQLALQEKKQCESQL